MKRFLVCTTDEELGRIGNVVLTPSNSSKYEIIEGAVGVTPLLLQKTHITQETANALVAKYPMDWAILTEDQVKHLEQVS
jgi:hypothetical protein